MPRTSRLSLAKSRAEKLISGAISIRSAGSLLKLRKYFFRFAEKYDCMRASRTLSGGAYASSRTLGAGCDGRERHQLTSDAARGRQKRVVLIPRCRDQVAWVMTRAATVTNKARTPGRARHKPYTIAQGRPGRSG